MSTQVLLKPSVIKLALIEAPNSQLCKEMVFIHMYSFFHFFISIAQVDKLSYRSTRRRIVFREQLELIKGLLQSALILCYNK